MTGLWILRFGDVGRSGRVAVVARGTGGMIGRDMGGSSKRKISLKRRSFSSHLVVKRVLGQRRKTPARFNRPLRY